MTKIEKKRFGEERALYGAINTSINDCRFEGLEDGESALKEAREIEVNSSFFDLRYPFWHNTALKIENCDMTERCRAPIWYSKEITVKNSRLHGTKALRECTDVYIDASDINSDEFGWFSKDITMTSTGVHGSYFMLRAASLTISNVTLDGKYSFQYIENSKISNCFLHTKDAFWHAKNIIIEDSVIDGEYLAWYSENLTFVNCKISGTQPFCYCKNLKLINCEMNGADFAFEKSSVAAEVTTHIISIKNPASGKIIAPSVGELFDINERSMCEIITGE